MAGPLMQDVAARLTPGSLINAPVFELPTLMAQPWGLAPHAPMKLEPGHLAVPAIRSGALGCRWIGAEPEKLEITGRDYRLSFICVGDQRGELVSCSIDPRLPVAERSAVPSSMPSLMTTYDEFDPETRRAFLEWIDQGRCNAAVPIAFPLHLVHSIDGALFKLGRHEIAAGAAVELDRLLRLFGSDVDFRGAAEPLIDACRLLDPDLYVPPIFASAVTNFGTEMPFPVRHYLGQELRQSSCLEADSALLFLLQQPGTHLDAHVGPAFPVVYHHWTENYSYRFNGGVEIEPTSTLTLIYDTLDGELSVEIQSDIPDPASAPISPDLQLFFLECCAEIEALRDLPVAQQQAIIAGLKSKPKLRGYQPAWSLRPDFEDRIRARLSRAEIVELPARDILADLFEEIALPQNKQVPVHACRRMQRALGDIGVGFEPDDRYGLPARLRPDSQIALFHEEQLPFQEPSDAFHLAQAAMTLSAIGTRSFAGLERISAGEIELRLPYRHHYSDQELRRLEASFRIMRSAGKPRELLASWPRRMKRLQRIKDIDLGFGVAFHAQAGNPLVKRFATAVSKALHNDDRRVDGFLREVNAQAELDAEIAAEGIQNVVQVGDFGAERVAPVGRQPTVPLTIKLVQSRIEGLAPVLVEILEALIEGPRPRTSLNEIARKGQLQLAGALEQLNEWSLAKFSGQLTRGHHPVRINPELFDAIELIVRQK